MKQIKLFILVGMLTYNYNAFAQITTTKLKNKTFIKCIKLSTVYLTTYDKDSNIIATNERGFFVNPTGDVITTNPLMFYGATYAEVKTSDNKNYKVNKVLAYDRYIRLLKISVDIGNDTIKPLKFCNSFPEKNEPINIVDPKYESVYPEWNSKIQSVENISLIGNIIFVKKYQILRNSFLVNNKCEVVGIGTFIPIAKTIDYPFNYLHTTIERIEKINDFTINKNTEGLLPLKESDKLIFKGIENFIAGLHEFAIEDIEKFIKTTPEDILAHYIISVSYSKLRLWENSIEHYKKIIKKDSNQVEAYNNLGFVYSQFKDSLGKAEECYNKAIRIDTNHAGAYFNIGGIYRKKDLWSIAIKNYQKSIQKDSTNIRVYYNLGVAYLQLEEWEKAIESFRKVMHPNQSNIRKNSKEKAIETYFEVLPHFNYPLEINLNLSSHSSNKSKGKVINWVSEQVTFYDPSWDQKYKKAYYGATYNQHMQQGIYNQHTQQLDVAKLNEREFYEDREDKNTQFRFLAVLRQLEHYREVIEYGKSAIKLNPNYEDVYYNTGLAYSELEQLDSAKKHLKKATDINQEYHEAWNELGKVYKKLKLSDKAEICYKKAIEVARQETKASEYYYNLGILYEESEHYEKALEFFQQATRKKQGYSKALNAYGKVYEKLQQKNKTYKFEYELQFIRDARHYNNIAEKYLEKKRWNKVLEYSHKAIYSDPNYYKPHYNLSLYHIRYGNSHIAYGELEIVKEANKNFAEAYLTLGKVYVKLEKYGAAKKEFREAIRLFKEQERKDDIRKVEELLKELEIKKGK